MHNPYDYQNPVYSDARFFGREKLIKRLISRLSAPTPLLDAVIGGRRSGKTSLLNKLYRELSGDVQAAGSRYFVPCIFDLQKGRPLTDSDDFFLWMLDEFGKALEHRKGLEQGQVVEKLQGLYRDERSRGPVDAFVQSFRSIDTQGNRLRLVILADEWENVLTAEWGDDLRPNLRSLLSNSPIRRNLGCVIAGATRMYTEVNKRDSPFENILDDNCLPALSREATLALACEPNGGSLPREVTEEVWRQTGGHPCMAQYVLYELWDEFAGQLQEVTAESVRCVAQTFDERTRHFSSWTKTLGRDGCIIYLFLLRQDEPVTYSRLREHFSPMTLATLRGALDALLYHGLVHCHGRGWERNYQIAGKMYRDWFLSAGKLSAPEQAKALEMPAGIQVLIKRIEQHIGPQTNIAGDPKGPVASGKFKSATAFGGGDAKDFREQEGD